MPPPFIAAIGLLLGGVFITAAFLDPKGSAIFSLKSYAPFVGGCSS